MSLQDKVQAMKELYYSLNAEQRKKVLRRSLVLKEVDCTVVNKKSVQAMVDLINEVKNEQS